ncbi:hybrid sensor histidine kinase/response regulator [Flavisphingomonas formosensis]|uniref:hybrid sensor histidine kinase/response regulator n=1 Tax=Flavisphingomonas formosensis TaxID=861534 RepID=UPI0012F806DC|nr:hybrid sensor histidine kinase/response regulator [Sphingomonas formosensis]
MNARPTVDLSPIRVLHLEDSAIDAELIGEYLRRAARPCTVERVWSRADFVRALEENRYDLIIADHQLPAFDGEAALAIAREIAPETPFVFVSGTLGEDVAVEALKRGATDYVVKQRLHRLPAVVDRALAEAHERSERRRAEEELRRLNETLEQRIVTAIAEREAVLSQLAELQKMEAVGQLTGGVAHDFNNLLTPIVGSLDLLRRRLEGDDRSQRLIAAAMQGADRAKTLVQRLLAFARRQVLEPRAVDAHALIEGMIDLVARTVGSQIEIRVTAAPDLPPARVDPGQLELALLNLAVNARDAMPGGGTLRFAIDAHDVGPDHGMALRHGRYVRISACDTGCGMDEETLKRAIEPFYSTKGVGKGTGLGLSMVHGLAAQSGGALHLESTPGRGTCAEMWLPVANEAAEDMNAGTPRGVPATPPAVILLVDDEERVRAGTAELLADLGHSVTEASSATHALSLLRDGLRPDLVITDYLMPGMTGADLAAEVQRLFPGMPVLLATGYAQLAGHQMASLPLLAKPFRQAELAGRIHELLAEQGSTIRGVA